MRIVLAVNLVLVTSICLWAVQNEDKKLRSSIDISPGKFGKALDARSSPALIEGNARFRKPPLTVECWAKLGSKKNFNILVASDTKESSLHWEIYSFKRNGFFSAYLPGKQPAEIISNVDICDSKWHYLAMQYDGKQVRLFVDGKIVKAKAVKQKPGLGPRPGALTIGMVLWRGGRIGCDGLIDEVRISNVIRDIDGTPAKAPLLDLNTVGLWHFDSLSQFAADPAWTPRPITGNNVPAWWKETDKDWVDGRLRQMNTGRTYNGTIAYPSWRGQVRAMRGTSIRLGDKGEAAVIFDRNQLRFGAGWTGDYLEHGNRRFGLLNTHRPAGDMMIATNAGPGWFTEKQRNTRPPATTALPPDWGHFQGMYRHGDKTVLSYRVGKTHILDHPWFEQHGGLATFTRTLQIEPCAETLIMRVVDLPPGKQKILDITKSGVAAFTKDKMTAVIVDDRSNTVRSRNINQNAIELVVPPHKKTRRLRLSICCGAPADTPKVVALSRASTPVGDLKEWTKPGPPQWTEKITTTGQVADNSAPYVIDTLTIPYDNPYKALIFLGGLDFMPNGDLAVCSAHGDVWLVRGVNEDLKKLTWKRFATGLYQPLGLKVVDGKIFVLERGQLTRLHDYNNDGEADFYECYNDHWHISGGEHSYDSCLQSDADGNFYFFNGGDTNTPTGGCLLRISKDGKKCNVFSTGFRHPIGLGASPRGVITGADQEGNWMPATRVDIYRRGGFYGDMRAHHRKTPPKIYDEPLCWLPREMDNSAGGQVWVTEGKFGPLSGQMLHLSYGRCRIMLLMQQKVGAAMQAGGVDLGLQFLSGIMRGRFHSDGHLYVCGMDGWQTAALRDGCLQRVRYTGKKVSLPVELKVHKNGVLLCFAQTLDKKSAENVNHYRIDRWNYRWSGDYGSKRWSVENPDKEGQDRVAIKSAKVQPDGKSVFFEMDDVGPVMQMQIDYNLRAVGGGTLQGTIYNTIHRAAGAYRNASP